MEELNFDGLRVLVVGDVMLDHYVTGTVRRISPEAPVPVVSKRNAWSVPGGAANVALGVSRLGCGTCLLGITGDDAAGHTLRQQTAAENIEAGLVLSKGRPTSCKTRVLAQGQQLLRVDEESCQKPSLEEFVALNRHLQEFLPTCHAVILSDYAKGVLLPRDQGDSLAQRAIAQAKPLGIPVIVDPKGVEWERYAHATCVTPNSAEFIAMCRSLGLWPPSSREPGRAERRELAMALCAAFDLSALLLTRGSKGMTLFQPGQEPVYIKATMRQVADVSGAGDTVIATLAACRAAGIAWPRAAAIANAAAGVAVTKLGAAPVHRSELAAALRDTGKTDKVQNLPQLLEQLRLWRDENQRVVFTNGCFDILHPGHISLLKQSAAMGDRLVVGMNSDASVRRLKGDSRPIQNEQSRSLLLASLEFVDAVVLFSEDTPEELIRHVRPDILVKGSDYQIDAIAGARFVQSYGGQVRLVDLVKGFSTTDIAKKIQETGAEKKEP